jgi:hypothetical protein
VLAWAGVALSYSTTRHASLVLRGRDRHRGGRGARVDVDAAGSHAVRVIVLGVVMGLLVAR